jgi:archaellum component FlaD/FlaE
MSLILYEKISEINNEKINFTEGTFLSEENATLKPASKLSVILDHLIEEIFIKFKRNSCSQF